MATAITDGAWRLCYDDDTLTFARRGDKVTSFRNEEAILTGGRAPHRPDSSGKVFVKEDGQEREYYPSVFGLIWLKQ